MDFLIVLFGLVLLFVGGEGLIGGSVVIAKKLGLSNLLIGVVIVGLGTSTPELLISASAALSDHTDIALGNVVGSNIANILLILGLASLINPMLCKDSLIMRDALAIVLASTFLLFMSFPGTITEIVGTLMLLSLAGYIYYCYRYEHALGRTGKKTDEEKSKLKLWQAAILVIVSLGALVFGADLLVEGASNLARSAGVSEAVIALSLVAVGTSIPELAAIIKPIVIAGQIAAFDIPFALAVALLCTVIIFLFKKVSRPTGIAFLLTYSAYMAWLFLSGNIGP